MIFGRLADWQRDKNLFPETFDRALSFLDGRNALSLADGKYPLDGENMFALVQSVQTEDEFARRFEIHTRYLDIQLLLTGRERHLYAPAVSGAALLEDNLAEKDHAFYAHPARYSVLALDPNDYAVYFPGEMHCPCIAASGSGEAIRKIVFKILWPQRQNG